MMLETVALPNTMVARQKQPSNVAPPTKVRQVEVIAEDPFIRQCESVGKENAEFRKRMIVAWKQIRALQEDIATVHADTRHQMDAVTETFTPMFAALEETKARLSAENDQLSVQLLASSHIVEVTVETVERARAERELAEGELGELTNRAHELRRCITDADAELDEIRAKEHVLLSELRALEESKRSGIVNLESVRAKNVLESKELTEEEQKLNRSQSQLEALRHRIADLKRARGQK
jgi:chromosome segregation ATPase